MLYMYIPLFWLFSVLSPFSLYSETESGIQRYLDLYHTFPAAFGPKGDWKQGEVEIVSEPQQMTEIQKTLYHRLLMKGLTEKEAKDRSCVGIIHEDAYWMWIRDAVIFPTGTSEVYNRFLHKKSLDGNGGSPVNGVATLALFPNQKILLNVIFRHATRSWEIELPRGGKNKNESLEDTARREVKEETGFSIKQLEFLGNAPFDSGSMTSFNAVFFASIDSEGESCRDDEEVIASLLALSKEEIMTGFSKGEIDVCIDGKAIKAYCRDPLLSYAILVAQSRGHFKK